MRDPNLKRGKLKINRPVGRTPCLQSGLVVFPSSETEILIAFRSMRYLFMSLLGCDLSQVTAKNHSIIGSIHPVSALNEQLQFSRKQEVAKES
jgi:hypothetical protein